MESNFTNSILEVFRYFSIFSYPPTKEEIHTFLRKKVSQEQLSAILSKMVKKGFITIKNFKLKTKNYPRYTLGEYSIPPSLRRDRSFGGTSKIQSYVSRKRISEEKIKKIMPYVKHLAKFSQIRLIGLSGSVAMNNATEDHDVDVFIITTKNRLWTGRCIAVILATILGLRRRRTDTNISNKICLNLFFDEANLRVPKLKETAYVAHEILQMKPLVSKNGAYEAFLKQNRWVYKIFPNAKEINSKIENLNSKQIQNSNTKSFEFLDFGNSNLFRISSLGFRIFNDRLELILRLLQLTIIKLHQTTEIVTDSQLWFHPNDFGKKMVSIFPKQDRK